MTLPATLHVAIDGGAVNPAGLAAPVLVAPSRAFLDAQLHRLGPTATLVWVYLSEAALDGSDVDTETLARWLGVNRDRREGASRSCRSVEHALDRLARFHRIQWWSTDTITVRVVTTPGAAGVRGPVEADEAFTAKEEQINHA
jgi:hypothetical protein